MGREDSEPSRLLGLEAPHHPPPADPPSPRSRPIDGDASKDNIAALVAPSQKGSAVLDIITHPTHVSVAIRFHRKEQLRHDGGVIAVPAMYALGLPFLRRRKSSFIHGAEDDVRELGEDLGAYLERFSQAATSLSA